MKFIRMIDKSDNMSDVTKKITLSVIVPCYNVEPYLDRSLTCLSRQWNGRTDYEIILINDASTDGTIDKLNDFKLQNPNNVIVIDKKVNEGAAQARNSGLDAARGEWIVFFDPDDALVDNGYSLLLNLIQDDDFEILSFREHVVNEKSWNDDLTHSTIDPKIDWTGSSQEYMLNYHYGTSIKFFFRRDILSDRRFKKLAFLEDLVFVLPVFLSDYKVVQTDARVYIYILRSSSATNMIDPEKLNRGCDDILTAIQFMDQCKDGKSDAIKKRIEERQVFYRGNLITRLILSNKSLNELKRHRDAIKELSIPIGVKNAKERLFDTLFEHPLLMMMVRPVYRAMRSRNSL